MKKEFILKNISLIVYSSIVLAVLLPFFSCEKRSLQEYVERGFFVPKIEGEGVATPCNISGDGKVYIPSNVDINYLLSINNKYDSEIKADIKIPKEKEEFFVTLPHITHVDAQKISMILKFNERAEPNAQNDFQGESVPIDIAIYNAKTNKYLHSIKTRLKCNTPPLPVENACITHSLESDEFSIHTPKNLNIHSDLKELHLTFSSKNGNGKIEKVIPISNAHEQDTDITFKMKDIPLQVAGLRLLNITVIDKAGLTSDEVKISSSMPAFDNITLEPATLRIARENSVNTGFAPPRIKELVSFFKTKDIWESEGFTIEYNVGFSPFEYNTERGLFFAKNTVNSGEYSVGVTLKKLSYTVAIATWKVKVFDSDDTSIDTEDFLIKDVTLYTSSTNKTVLPLPDINSVSFNSEGGVQVAKILIPYTGFNTNCRLHIKAGNSSAKIDDASLSSPSSVFEKNIEIKKDAGSSATLNFTVTAESGNASQQYRIELIRDASCHVKVHFTHAVFVASNASILSEWSYALEEQTEKGVKEFDVAKNANIDFKVTLPDDWKVQEILSTDGSHDTATIQGKKEFSLVANTDFDLRVTIAPQTVASWEITKNNGEEHGKLTGNVEGDNIVIHREGTIVKLGKNLIFTATPEPTYKVKEWQINSVSVLPTTQNVELTNEGNTLKILNVQEDKRVSVSFEKKTFNIFVKHSPEGQGTIKIYDSTSFSELSNPATVEIGKKVMIEATEKGLTSPFIFKEWAGLPQSLIGLKHDKTPEITVNEDLTLTAIFAKKTKVEFQLPAVSGNFGYLHVEYQNPPGANITHEIKKSSSRHEINIHKGFNIILTARPQAGREVEKWTISVNGSPETIMEGSVDTSSKPKTSFTYTVKDTDENIIIKLYLK